MTPARPPAASSPTASVPRASRTTACMPTHSHRHQQQQQLTANVVYFADCSRGLSGTLFYSQQTEISVLHMKCSRKTRQCCLFRINNLFPQNNTIFVAIINRCLSGINVLHVDVHIVILLNRLFDSLKSKVNSSYRLQHELSVSENSTMNVDKILNTTANNFLSVTREGT